MAVTLKIKRRASSGNAGSPATLKSGELAFNENTSDKLLYYGYGDDGSGNATSIVAIGGAEIPNAGLANSAVTINSNSVSLGGSLTLDSDDIGEGSTNQYFTNTRARGAVSVTDAGGDGSLAYDSSTGVITYTGPSSSEVRAHLSATTASGITYNSSTGVIALSAVPNSSLANSSLTINSSSVSLGGSLTLDTDAVGEGSSNLYFTDGRAQAAISVTDAGGDGSLAYDNSTGVITYTGPSAAETRAHISATTNTGVTYNSGTGVVALASIPNSSLTNSAVTVNSNSVSLGASITLDTDDVGEGSSNLYYTDARSRAALSGSGGVIYNSSTGAFTLGSIPNSALSNSSITINGVATPLGGSTTTTTVGGSLGGTITLQGTAGEVAIATNSGTNTFTFGLPSDVNVNNDLAVGGDVTVTGDLTVNGALVSLSTTEVKVEDKNILLGDTASPNDTTADGGGITLKGASDYSIVWVNATDSWTFNQNINVTTGGLSIGGTQVINSSRVVSNLAITGSGNTIDNIEIDGGTF